MIRDDGEGVNENERVKGKPYPWLSGSELTARCLLPTSSYTLVISCSFDLLNSSILAM